MKRSTRKLNLRVETIRNLSRSDLNRVAGGVSSAKAGLCSTEDSGCCDTASGAIGCYVCPL